MTAVAGHETTRSASSDRRATVAGPTEAVLCRLEGLGARLPHVLALPVMLAHEALCALSERR